MVPAAATRWFRYVWTKAPPELFVSMLPPDDALVALEWTGTEPLVYTMKAIENGQANWQACDDCALTACSAYLGTDQPLILKPGVTWISLRLSGQHTPARFGMLGQLSQP